MTLRIDGEWIDTEETIPVSNKYTGEVLGQMSVATRENVHQAVVAGQRAMATHLLRGCLERGQNSPTRCHVVAQHALSRSENVRHGAHASLNVPHWGADPVHILGWLPRTAWV